LKLVLFIFIFILITSSFNTIHSERWKKTVIDYYINIKANTASEKCIRESFKKWEKILNNKVRFFYHGRNSAGIKRDNKNTVSFITQWPLNISKSLIGYTYLWYQKGSIVEADVIFNQEIYNFTIYPDKVNQGYYYLETILLHEIGHLLGLTHLDNQDSIMKPLFKYNETINFTIDQESIRLVKKLYGIE
jgi:predicted Zn-dependent protease